MKKAILHDMLKGKKNGGFDERYKRYFVDTFSDFRIPEITVHGRFQSSLHMNHFYTYVASGFRVAEKVHFLITNPDLQEHKADKKTLDREQPENNPFSYEERVFMISDILNRLGVPSSRYDFQPWKITEDSEWERVLDQEIPNLVNTYGEWSKDKLAKFRANNFQVLHSKFPKLVDVSGTRVREVLRYDCSSSQKVRQLKKIGHMEEAIPALMQVMEKGRVKKFFKVNYPKQTKILATLSHRVDSEEGLKRLANAGVNIFRLNFAHQDRALHRATICRIKKTTPQCEIMADLQGPAVRLGDFSASVKIEKNEKVCLVTKKDLQSIEQKKFFVNHRNFHNDVEAGDKILLGNGQIVAEVLEVEAESVAVQIKNSGLLHPRWHVNLFQKDTSLPDLTAKDWNDLEMAIQEGVDAVAVSFVRSKEAIEKIRERLQKKKAEKTKIWAKIETQSGMDNLEEIIQAADGVMVARGDLSVETPLEELAKKQEKIVFLAKKHKKFCIVATEMLKSMTKNNRPTCAEITDVSLAVWQGADSIMLSEETANSVFPIEAVKTMKKIADNC